MNILIVEDDENKSKTITEYISSIYPDIELSVAHSYQSGVQMAIDYKYDLLLLDMSIPNFDITENEGGGEALKNGGELIIQELLDENIDFNCTIITQYETFNNEPLTTIDARLRKSCGDKYQGCIKYDSYNDDWKDLLKINIENVIHTHNR